MPGNKDGFPGTAVPTQRDAANEYIAKYHIQALLGHLLQLCVYHMPDDPKEFMRQEIEKIQSKNGTPSELLTRDDLNTMFEMIDVTRQKRITKVQLRNACRNLQSQAGDPEEAEELERRLAEVGDTVNAETFVDILGTQLRTRSYWSSDSVSPQ